MPKIPQSRVSPPTQSANLWSKHISNNEYEPSKALRFFDNYMDIPKVVEIDGLTTESEEASEDVGEYISNVIFHFLQ